MVLYGVKKRDIPTYGERGELDFLKRKNILF
jgi:hypothetical protein